MKGILGVVRIAQETHAHAQDHGPVAPQRCEGSFGVCAANCSSNWPSVMPPTDPTSKRVWIAWVNTLDFPLAIAKDPCERPICRRYFPFVLFPISISSVEQQQF